MVIPTLRHAGTREMLKWNAHDYRTEEELRSIVEDLKRIRDSKRPFSEAQNAIWEFARCDLADLKEARDNVDKERSCLDRYREWIAANPCPHSEAKV